jgi:glyoxalase family protein
MANNIITGIHHITALADDPQKNVDFYVGILGLRLVKKTVNFDAPDVYHLYYGDEIGNVGTIMTFFPFKGIARGRHGTGQATISSFSIPENAMGYWVERLKKYDVRHSEPQTRFEEVFITFYDSDGLKIELVANAKDSRPAWTNGYVPEEYAIRGFHSFTLEEVGYEKTAGLLTTLLNHKLVGEQGNRFRYESGAGGTGTYVDIIWGGNTRGLQGGGTVHHVAFGTPNDDIQLKLRENLVDMNYHVSPVMDRNYFHSIYFREPGNILFEVATNDIGFTVDEAKEKLGLGLKLPEWYETQRTEIEKHLLPIKFPKL